MWADRSAGRSILVCGVCGVRRYAVTVLRPELEAHFGAKLVTSVRPGRLRLFYAEHSKGLANGIWHFSDLFSFLVWLLIGGAVWLAVIVRHGDR